MSPPKHQQPLSSARAILVVDDHDLVRLGLRTLLLSHAASAGTSIEVLDARSLDAALGLYRQHGEEIALVLLDLHLADTRGLAGLQAFRDEFPAARVVVLSGSTDPVLMRRALALGATAYLAKSADLQHVVDHLEGEGFFGAGGKPAAIDVANPASCVAEASGTTEVWTATGQRMHLTPRQAQVLEWIMAGHSNRQIAERTHLSEGTIKNHVSALLLMFGARSRAQLISQLR